MSLLALPVIAIVALVCAFLSLVILFVINARVKVRFILLESQWQASELLLNNLQSTNDTLQKDIKSLQEKHDHTVLENSQVSKQLEHRINTLKTQLSDQQENVTLLQDEQSDDRF